MKFSTLAAALTCTLGTASAAIYSASDAVPAAIPDGDTSGLARSLTINAPAGMRILSLEVTLDISSTSDSTAFLGDLYVYITNGSELAVLINRPGRRDDSNAGYDDDQSINATFSALGANDFHDYRVALYGSHTSPLTGPVTGTWQPDARFTDPAQVRSADARLAGLSIYNGDNPAGTWHLFAADLSSGSAHQINTWSLSITAEPIPEPASTTALLLAALATATRRRRTRL